jgi:single-stranded-DNA-specific exonuclease
MRFGCAGDDARAPVTLEIARRSVPHAVHALIAAGVPPLLARIYAARGITGVAELDCSLKRLPEASLLKGIDAAAQRLADAIMAGERMLIVADYDADGATACAVGVRGLRALGGKVDFLVPNRFEFGYGLTPEIVALAATRDPRLIITVDNGIASVEGVDAARRRGIDVVITDHHLPGAALPVTPWIVNPNQPGCAFPSKHLAGVGVMFYVLAAVRARLVAQGVYADSSAPRLAGLLDLVALGTIADVVRLDHVNRVLVDNGLRRIRGGRMQPGVRALLSVAGRDPTRVRTTDLGFAVAPRLNAAGRMADMSIGIACLLADDETTAIRLAGELDRLNRDRRVVEADMQQQALDDLDAIDAGDAYTVCLYRPEWHQGVIGIIASRLKDRLHRPAIVFAKGADGLLRGSGRTIAGLHLRDAIDCVAKRLPGAIVRFGGHAFAAGLTVAEPQWPAFAIAFEAVAREWLTPAGLARITETDGELSIADIDPAIVDGLGEAVWGQGFPAPCFDAEFVVRDQRTVGGKHRRLILEQGGHTIEAIVLAEENPLPERIHATFRPEMDEYAGLRRIQLVVEHWRAAATLDAISAL